MPLLFVFGILLLPAAELVLLVLWFGDAPFWALGYLLLTGAVGVFLMRLARAGLGAMMQGWSQMQAQRQGQGWQGLSPLSFILLGKLWMVGALLLFPGYITDIIALMIAVVGWFVAPSVSVRGGGDSASRGDGATVAQGRVVEDEDDGYGGGGYGGGDKGGDGRRD